MKEKTSNKEQEDLTNPVLGERHDYKGEPEKTITNTALKLGFSSEEIKQLVRLYTEK